MLSIHKLIIWAVRQTIKYLEYLSCHSATNGMVLAKICVLYGSTSLCTRFQPLDSRKYETRYGRVLCCLQKKKWSTNTGTNTGTGKCAIITSTTASTDGQVFTVKYIKVEE